MLTLGKKVKTNYFTFIVTETITLKKNLVLSTPSHIKVFSQTIFLATFISKSFDFIS